MLILITKYLIVSGKVKFLSSEFNIYLFVVNHLFISAIGITVLFWKWTFYGIVYWCLIISNKCGFGLWIWSWKYIMYLCEKRYLTHTCLPILPINREWLNLQNNISFIYLTCNYANRDREKQTSQVHCS